MCKHIYIVCILLSLTYNESPTLMKGVRRFVHRIGGYSHNFDLPQEKEFSSDSIPLSYG